MKSAEEKAATKDASLLKQAAHTARKIEFRQAEEAVKERVDAGPLHQKYLDARAAEDLAMKKRDDLVNEVRQEIARLNDKMAAIEAEQKVLTSAASKLRNEASNLYRGETQRMMEDVAKLFPDLKEDGARWSSVSWIPPNGYIEKFAADNAEDLAKKKAKRDAKAKK